MSEASEYSDIQIHALHKRALADAKAYYDRAKHGRIKDKGWRVSVGNNGAALHSHFECDGEGRFYSTML